MARNENADWEAVEREYRAGTLSIREIGRQYKVSDTAIGQKAKQYGWLRDLSDKVRSEVRNRLLRTQLCTPVATEAEIIDKKATELVQVEHLHRNDIKRHRNIIQILAEQLEDVAVNRQEVADIIKEETEDDKRQDRRNRMLKAISLPTHAAVARDLSTSLKNLIPLERVAYGLDDGSTEGKEGIKIIIQDYRVENTPDGPQVVSVRGVGVSTQ